MEKVVKVVICSEKPEVREVVSSVFVHYLEKGDLPDILEFYRERDRVPDGVTYRPENGTGWEYADSEVLYVARWWEVDISD